MPTKRKGATATGPRPHAVGPHLQTASGLFMLRSGNRLQGALREGSRGSQGGDSTTRLSERGLSVFQRCDYRWLVVGGDMSQKLTVVKTEG